MDFMVLIVLIGLVRGDVISITQEIVSDVTTFCEGPSRRGDCVATYLHPVWTANIPGATWIWETNFALTSALNKPIKFTKDFYIGGVPTKGVLYIAQDDYFTAYINGKQVACNNPGTFTLLLSQIYDVTGSLKPGLNTLTVEVTNSLWSFAGTSNPGGLLYKLVFSSNLKI